MRALIAPQHPSACFACAAASSSNCSRYCCGQYAPQLLHELGPRVRVARHDDRRLVHLDIGRVAHQAPPRGVGPMMVVRTVDHKHGTI